MEVIIMSEGQKETCKATALSTITILLVGWVVYCIASPFTNYTWTF